ncbi:MAG: hypothetical protein U5K84_10275 [Alkalibacterium sp.]|nr:hypothetical protein [Alkalibacterium sp.]
MKKYASYIIKSGMAIVATVLFVIALLILAVIGGLLLGEKRVEENAGSVYIGYDDSRGLVSNGTFFEVTEDDTDLSIEADRVVLENGKGAE